MKKIIVSITNDIVTDQRVAKVCDTLYKNGYEVFLIGRKLKNSLPVNRKYKTKRFKLIFNKGVLFYAEYNIRLFFFLLFTKKDILLSNDLDTLLPNYLINKLQQKKLVFDSHELFSEIPELVTKPVTKKFWNLLEKNIIPDLNNCYTVCDSISNYYSKIYQTKFHVIRNVPKAITTNIQKNNEQIIIYQGALNLGRGIELMLKTMLYLDNKKLIIVGSGDIQNQLKKESIKLGIEEKVIFMGRKTPHELKKITPIASLGISFEENLGLNYKFALPNKVFDYIQAEIPALVSDLPEMKKIVLKYNVGEYIKDRTPEKIAKQIEEILSNDYSEALKKAKKELVWENEEKKLVYLFNNLM